MATRDTDLRIGQRDYAALDDRMLVLDFQAGDPEAFVEIHRRYGGLARHVCQRFLRNRQDADEAFQETMIRVFQGLYRFNGRYALQPWIARIATNVSLDHVRAAARRPQVEDGALEDGELPELGDGPEEAYERLVQRDLVLSVLEGLPEKHRAALVLRELDGRSHREIARALDISPAQAKALIHRAKGSFRRGWLRAVTERGGFAGVAVLPLLWLLRAGDLARRIVDRAGHATQQAAQVATPELVSAAASSPAAPAAATGLAERVVAAGMTLLLAGGVTVGAATIAKNRGDRGRQEVVAAAPASPSTAAVVAPPAEPVQQPADARVRDPRDPGPTPVEIVAEEPSPGAETPADPGAGSRPSPSAPPGPSPQPSPSPDPSPSPAPTIPPAPAWSGAFAVDWPSGDLCGCGPGVGLVASKAEGSLLVPSGGLLVVQDLRGAATDAEGDEAWLVDATLTANLRRDSGTLDLVFRLSDGSATVTYVGTARTPLVTGDLEGGEPVVFTWFGSYTAAGAEQDQSPIRTAGRLTVELAVWADGSTPFRAQISILP